MMVRIYMGLAEAIVLAIVPWTAMFAVGRVFGKTHSVSQASYYLVLLLGGGLLFFAMAVLISSLISGEYTAPVVSFGAVVVTAVSLSSAALRPYLAPGSDLRFLSGPFACLICQSHPTKGILSIAAEERR